MDESISENAELDTHYLYIIYEAPAEEPYFCKLGITKNPLARLESLQQGNPRYLRVPSQERKPQRNFGFRLPNRDLAVRFEKELFDEFAEMGIRLRKDFNYTTEKAPYREWIEGIHPDELWELVFRRIIKFAKRNDFYHFLIENDNSK